MNKASQAALFCMVVCASPAYLAAETPAPTSEIQRFPANAREAVVREALYALQGPDPAHPRTTTYTDNKGTKYAVSAWNYLVGDEQRPAQLQVTQHLAAELSAYAGWSPKKPSLFGLYPGLSDKTKKLGRGGQCLFFVNLVLYRSGADMDYSMHDAWDEVANQSEPIGAARAGDVVFTRAGQGAPWDHAAIVVKRTEDDKIELVESNVAEVGDPQTDPVGTAEIISLRKTSVSGLRGYKVCTRTTYYHGWRGGVMFVGRESGWDSPCHLVAVNPDGSGLGIVRWNILYEGEPVSGAALSPDGARLAVAAPYKRPEGPGGAPALVPVQTQIRVLQLSTGSITYTTGPLDQAGFGVAENLRWSPDGNSIAFETDCHDIYAVDLATGTVRRLTRDADNYYPTWSPDSKQIFFEKMTPGEDWRPYCVEVTGTHPPKPADLPGRPQWSPDGERVAYSRTDGQLWVGDFADGAVAAPRRVTAESERWRVYYPIVWSPDGTKIAFLDPVQGVICVVDANGGSAKPVAGGYLIWLVGWTE